MKKMNQKFRALLGCALALTTLTALAGCSTAEPKQNLTSSEEAPSSDQTTKNNFNKIITFGDSYSDNGSAFAISSAIIESGNTDAFIKPGELYWENRYSNGLSAIEVAADLSSLEIENYATGGATTGNVNYSSWMDSLGESGVHGQIEKYEMSLNGQTPTDDTLFFVFAGTNDYCKFIDFNEAGTVADVAKKAAENTETSVRKLAALGAKNILVSEVNDVSIMPYEITEGRQDSAKEFAAVANPLIAESMEQLEKELDLTIEVFELTNLTDRILENPSEYGFENHLEVIQPTWPEVLPAQTEKLDSYMFFDEWHPSAALHQVIGTALAKEIEQMLE